jgi:hypothetical protein
MAYEIHSQRTLHVYAPPADLDAGNPFTPASGEVLVNASELAAASESDLRLRHNWSHDLETFFWLLFWFLAIRLLLDSGSPEFAGWEKWRLWAKSVFRATTTPSDLKCAVFTTSRLFPARLAACLPPQHRPLVQALDDVRRHRWRSHYNRQPGERSRAYHAPYFTPVRRCLQSCLEHTSQPGMTMPLQPYLICGRMPTAVPSINGIVQPQKKSQKRSQEQQLSALPDSPVNGVPLNAYAREPSKAPVAPGPPAKKRRITPRAGDAFTPPDGQVLANAHDIADQT